jgi:hypothetical protein
MEENTVESSLHHSDRVLKRVPKWCGPSAPSQEISLTGVEVRNQSGAVLAGLVGPAARVVPVEPHMGANWGPSSYKDYM